MRIFLNTPSSRESQEYDLYRSEPYLLLKSEQDVEIVWLPNYKERYRINTWDFFGKADFEFKYGSAPDGDHR
jgi:hypothetical protein